MSFMLIYALIHLKYNINPANSNYFYRQPTTTIPFPTILTFPARESNDGIDPVNVDTIRYPRLSHFSVRFPQSHPEKVHVISSFHPMSIFAYVYFRMLLVTIFDFYLNQC